MKAKTLDRVHNPVGSCWLHHSHSGNCASISESSKMLQDFQHRRRFPNFESHPRFKTFIHSKDLKETYRKHFFRKMQQKKAPVSLSSECFHPRSEDGQEPALSRKNSKVFASDCCCIAYVASTSHGPMHTRSSLSFFCLSLSKKVFSLRVLHAHHASFG